MIKIRGLRWYIAIMLCLVTTINYLDRTSLSVAGPVLKDKLQIDEQHFAYIIMCFQFSYGLMQPVMGRVMDWLGIKRGFSLAAIWWSIANMLHAFAQNAFFFRSVSRTARRRRGGQFPRRRQDHFRVVPRQRAHDCLRYRKYRFRNRFAHRDAICRLDYLQIRMAGGICYHGGSRFYMGCFMAFVL